jgi:hypothetical protein
MNDRVDDEARLRRLLSDAVSDIEPENRLDELRASVHPSPKVVPMSRSRSWYAAAGIVATAAVIGVVAYVTSVVGDQGSTLGPATDSGTAVPTETTATDPAASQAAEPQYRQLPVYYLGHGPDGDVLFHQPSLVRPDASLLDSAVSGLMTDPKHPGYRTGWAAGSIISAHPARGVVQVEVSPDTAQRPAAWSVRTANEVVQQAVWTFQGASGKLHAKVQFVRNGKPASTVFGIPATQPIARGRVLDVLSLMNIGNPSYDGQRYPTGRLVVSGTNNAFQGSVVVKLLRHTSSGDKTVLTKSGLAGGTGAPDRLFPWRLTLDTSQLPRGTYTIVAQNDDPSRRGSPATDTRVIVLR